MKIFCAVILALLSYGQASALTIATGSHEGTYFKIAQDIKQIAEKEGVPIQIVETNGSFDNINLLGAGKVDLAIMQLDVFQFVAEIIPFARTTSAGTGWRSTLNPISVNSAATRSACGAQSPGGLSEGTLTSSARNRVSRSRCRAR